MRGIPKKKKQQLTTTQQKYQNLLTAVNPKPRIFRNAIAAFIWGGVVCLLGQFLVDFYAWALHLSEEKANNPAVVTVILIGALLTGFGVFDKLARFAGAGLAVPVTGFANSIVAAALEFKREGFVQGIGGKMFSLAGSVIVYGVVTAFFVGLIYSLLHLAR